MNQVCFVLYYLTSLKNNLLFITAARAQPQTDHAVETIPLLGDARPATSSNSPSGRERTDVIVNQNQGYRKIFECI